MRIEWIVCVSDWFEYRRTCGYTSSKPVKDLETKRIKFHKRLYFAVKKELITEEVGKYMEQKFENCISTNNWVDLRSLITSVRKANKVYKQGELLKTINRDN